MALAECFRGCFSWYGFRSIVLLKGSITSKTYAKIIQNYVIPILDEHFLHSNRNFQEDNTLAYCSKVTMAAHEDVKIVMLQWPVQSLNLNSIENMWMKIKVMVHCYNSPLFNIQMLEKYVKDAWDDTPSEYFKKLIDSMPQRIEVVIAANRYSINY